MSTCVSATLLTFLTLSADACQEMTLTPIGTYQTGLFDKSAAEIVGYHAGTKRLFSVNGGEHAVDVLDVSDPRRPRRIMQVPLTTLGAGATSLAVHGDLVAVAVEGESPRQRGRVAFLNPRGGLLSAVEVGYLPDMVCFTPDGRKVLAANEGQPTDDYEFDPEGSVSLIDVSGGPGGLGPEHVTQVDFRAFNDVPLPPSVRVFGPGATAAQDFEPEYIAVTPDSKTAFVGLQENNAIAVIDVDAAEVTRIMGLGFKDHAAAGNGLDASDSDGAVRIRPWPVRGMYQPDAIACFALGTEFYLVTANEGDHRNYNGFCERVRVEDLALNTTAFPDAATLKKRENLGRLRVTNTLGDANGDGLYEALYAFGTRSFSIWTTDGRQVFDSGDRFERITAERLPAQFNSNNDDNNSFDKRSDDKGPEPEGLVLGVVGQRRYAFVGLERIGGVMVYEITEPRAPRFVTYVNNRRFVGDPAAGVAGDLGPEGLTFIPAAASPNGRPLLVTANEVSGTITIFQIDVR